MDCVLLIYANKQDNPLMSVANIMKSLELQNFKHIRWFLQASCAVTGEGLYEGLDWMST